MSIFITGITGILGSALVEENKNRKRLLGIYKGDYKITDTDYVRYRPVDVCKRDLIFKTFKEEKISCVIHTAGVADTDMCEKERFYKMAYVSNVKGTENMIEFARRKKAKLVYVSTNAVFDGENPPYSEEDTPNPINRYGAIKLECENMVRKNIKNHLIIRPILMYGLNNPNERKSFFIWILEKLENRERINVVDDVFENPLLSYQCAEFIWKLLDKDKTGTYHIAGKDVLSRFQVSRVMAKVFSLDKELINPVPSSFFKEIAPRPKNTSYDTRKIERELNVKPVGLEQGLTLLRARLADHLRTAPVSEPPRFVINERN